MLRCNGATAWPTFSTDPLEQFLVEEAILMRIDIDEAEARQKLEAQQRLEQARLEAREEARRELELHKAREAASGVR